MTMNSPRGIYQMFGVFHKGELESVNETAESARESAGNIHSRMDRSGNTIPVIPANCYIKPVFVLETDLNAHFLFGARQNLLEAQRELTAAEKEYDLLLEDVIKSKGMMPDNMWQRKHRAFLRCTAYKQVVEALEQSSAEKFVSGG